MYAMGSVPCSNNDLFELNFSKPLQLGFHFYIKGTFHGTVLKVESHQVQF